MTSRNRVMIVDDEPLMRELLSHILSERYFVSTASNGEEAIQKSILFKPKVIILDISMPNLSGIETCRRMRSEQATKHCQIIMLTAYNELDKRIKSFDAGADDFLEKPFDGRELLSRVESKALRYDELVSRTSVDGIPYQLGKLTLDTNKLKVYFEEAPLEVSPIEFKILQILIKNAGETIGRDLIAKSVWGDECESDRLIDPHMSSLRKKLKNGSVELKTVYGSGYSLIQKAL